MHCDRIFAGTKQFELRRRLPRKRFDKVFLYQTGGAGVVGSFDVSAIYESSVPNLWKTVGTAATSRARFESYFEGVKTGFAIEISNPVQFVQPVSVAQLKKRVPTFIPPRGTLWLSETHPISRCLSQTRDLSIAASKLPRSVSLRAIAESERVLYRQLVTSQIGKNYDGIAADFAEFNLGIHDAGVDPFGFFTKSKEVLTICDPDREAIGFTTLTFKRGGSVKSGPTILFRPYRHIGYGLATRVAIEKHVVARQSRKLYCTAPAVAVPVIAYLLNSGMRIEAQLEKHYSARHDELVFGKVLGSRRKRRAAITRRHYRLLKGRVVEPETLNRPSLVRQLAAMFGDTWAPVTHTFMERILAAALSPRADAPKPKAIVCAMKDADCVAAVLLVPKRGGPVKGLLLRVTNELTTLSSAVREAESRSKALKGRKLYFLHPLEDEVGVKLLRACGYSAEGIVREPYVLGQDVVILSKFLAS